MSFQYLKDPQLGALKYLAIFYQFLIAKQHLATLPLIR